MRTHLLRVEEHGRTIVDIGAALIQLLVLLSWCVVPCVSATAACNVPAGDEFPVTLAGDQELCLLAAPGNYVASAPVSGACSWSSDGVVMGIPVAVGCTATVPSVAPGFGWVDIEFVPDLGQGSGICTARLDVIVSISCEAGTSDDVTTTAVDTSPFTDWNGSSYAWYDTGNILSRPFGIPIVRELTDGLGGIAIGVGDWWLMIPDLDMWYAKRYFDRCCLDCDGDGCWELYEDRYRSLRSKLRWGDSFAPSVTIGQVGGPLIAGLSNSVIPGRIRAVVENYLTASVALAATVGYDLAFLVNEWMTHEKDECNGCPSPPLPCPQVGKPPVVECLTGRNLSGYRGQSGFSATLTLPGLGPQSVTFKTYWEAVHKWLGWRAGGPVNVRQHYIRGRVYTRLTVPGMGAFDSTLYDSTNIPVLPPVVIPLCM